MKSYRISTRQGWIWRRLHELNNDRYRRYRKFCVDIALIMLICIAPIGAQARGGGHSSGHHYYHHPRP